MKSALVLKIIESNKIDMPQLLEQKRRVYSFVNPVSYLDARRHQSLFGSMDGLFADGSILTAAIRMVYGAKVERRSCDWTSVAKQVFEHLEQTGKSIYLIGSRQADMDQAVAILRQQCPRARIVGSRNGYFASDDERDAIIRRIVTLNPDFLMVGMGIVKQEAFLLRAKELGFDGIGLTCGGFFHQTAQHQVNYYPDWIDRTNLRFLYRMYKEPHTRRRYLFGGVNSCPASC